MDNIIPCGCPQITTNSGLNHVEYIQFNDIVDRAILELASIGIYDIYDLLTINERLDGFVVMCQILKRSIDKFEYLEPFGIDIYPYYVSGQTYEFTDNFKEFLEGKVNRMNLQFIPRVIVAIVGTYLGTLRGVRYRPPYMLNVTYTGQYKTNIITNRPYRMIREGIRFTEDSVYYYLSENYKPRLKRFRDLFLVTLGNYIIRLNENLDHPNLPLTTFQGLRDLVSELSSQNQTDFDTSFGYYDAYSFE